MLKQKAVLEMALPPEEYQLGSLKEVYQTRVTRSGWIVFLILMLLVLLLIGVGIGSFFWGLLPLLKDPFFWSPMMVIISVVFPLFVIVVIPLVLFWQLRTENQIITPLRRKVVVSLYTSGLLYCEGRKRQVILWEQLHVVERLSMRSQTARYQIRLEDTTSLTLSTAIADVHKLGTAIEQEVVKRLLPQVLKDYATHKPIVFPGLCLTQEIISKSDESLPWQAVERIHFSFSKLTGSEQLIVKERGVKKDWFTAPIAQFRNLCVLEALLEQLSKEKHFSLDTSLLQGSGKSIRHPDL